MHPGRFLFLGVLLWALATARPAAPEGSLPNILWITCEDTGPHLGCYGDPDAITPNLDRLAARGLRYRRVWSTAPVCAPARTAIVSGLYPSSTGSEHMRSLVKPPPGTRMYPQFLRERGYYCSNNSKEDYNLEKPGVVWDESSSKAHWKNRRPGQPFFAVFNITVTHESQVRTRPHTFQHDPSKVRIPAYHPDTLEVRQDWAQYHDRVTEMDALAGGYLRELEAAGLAEDTIVFFYGDHGPGLPRCKRWPYNSGLHVPLIVSVPSRYRSLAPEGYVAGGSSGRLVSFVDLAPAVLSLAGIRPPDWMQGHAFLGPFAAPAPRYLYGQRGRMDERYDLVRSVTDGRFVYIRNYLPHLIYGQHVAYMFETPTTRVWKELYDQQKLGRPQSAFWETKPPEELYDLESDPDEVRNLAQVPAHRPNLEELRQANRGFLLRIRDAGFLPEAERARRAGSSTLFELAHDDARYPLGRLLATAELASSLKPEAIPDLEQATRDPDSGVRYWGVMGLLMRGAPAVGAARATLLRGLDDESPSVRIAAAQAVAQFGDPANRDTALAVLGGLAAPDRNGIFVALEALNAIDALGPLADPLKPRLRHLSTDLPEPAARAGQCVGRLLDHILGRE